MSAPQLGEPAACGVPFVMAQNASRVCRASSGAHRFAISDGGSAKFSGEVRRAHEGGGAGHTCGRGTWPRRSP